MDKDIQYSNNNYERSTNDTLNSNYQQYLKTESSVKNKINNDNNMSEDRNSNNLDSKDSNENRNLSDKFKAKRNIINCANKTENVDTNRP